MSKKSIISTLLFLLCLPSLLRASGTKDDVENVQKYRFSAEFEVKIIKGLKLNLAPELRFYEGFDSFLLGSGLTYKTFGCIYLGASYRLDMYREELGTDSMTGRTEYDWETFHRYGFDVTYKDTFKRFTPSFRLRYNNYSDDDTDDKEFLRYRAKLSYNIKKCKLTPFTYAEAFHRLEDNRLYKMRYSWGFDVKAGKHSSFTFDYKLDFFILKYTNAHIFSAGYKCSF